MAAVKFAKAVTAVKFGLLSTANINRLFLEGARQANGVEIAAVASRDKTKAVQYARHSGFAVQRPAAAQACWTCVISRDVGVWPCPG